MKFLLIIILLLTGCSADIRTTHSKDLNITCEKINFDESNLYFYNAVVVDVYDGDTITLDIDLGFNMWMKNERIRLNGINSPEIRTKNIEEKKAGYKARDYFRSLILNKNILIKTIKDKKGKYGRYLGEIFLKGLNINDKMVQQGYAKYKTY